MKQEIFQSINALLLSDPTVTSEQRAQIVKACRQSRQRQRRRLGSAKQAAEILRCHPKTVYRYVQRGLLTAIHYSARRVRFDLDAVEEFAASGVPLEDE